MTPEDLQQLWAHLRSSWLRCALRAERTVAAHSWLAAAVLLCAEASYCLQSISRITALRLLAAALTTGVTQFLVMPVTIVRLPSSAAALLVNMPIAADSSGDQSSVGPTGPLPGSLVQRPHASARQAGALHVSAADATVPCAT